MLEVKDVHTYYGDSYVLQGISLQVERGQVVGILGRNGMGKTTLIRSIVGFTPPRQGHIRFKNQDVTGWASNRVVALGLGLVPQGRRVFPSLTVLENLGVAARERGQGSGAWTIDRVLELFPRLRERRRQRAGTLSGGERQMLAMARALVAEPDLLLLDEPSAGLSPLFMDAIFEKIREINEAGVPILMVEQNARRALAMSHRGYVLDLGRNRFEGTGADLLHDPKVIDLYLGGTGRIDN
jgi:ABC-type branched-subunit amino acid transport system ATPase component